MKYENRSLLLTIIGIATAVISSGFIIYSTVDTSEVEEYFVTTTTCDSLLVYIQAGVDGKDFFAQWTIESQETINFRITDHWIDKAQERYEWKCDK